VAAAERASFEAETSRQVVDFLIDLFQLSDPSRARGEEIRAVDILDRGAVRIREELRDRPLVQARLLGTIGQVYQALGLYRRGVELLRQALEDQREVHPGDHPDVAAGLRELGSALTNSSQYGEAETLFRQALDMQRRLLGDSEDSELAETLLSLSVVLQKQGRHGDALGIGEEGLAVQRRVLGDEHPTIAGSLHLLSTLHRLSGNLEVAEELARETLARHEQAGASEVRLAEAHSTLGTVLMDMRRLEEARERFQTALALRRRVFGNADPRVAESLNNLAAVEAEVGDREAALDRYQEALEIKRQLLSAEDPRIAVSLLNLSALLMTMDRYAEAEPLQREALACLRRTLDPGHWKVAHAELSLGGCLGKLGKHDEAVELTERGYRGLHAALGSDHWRTRKGLERLITVLEDAGRVAEARTRRAELAALEGAGGAAGCS
jgi:tetratricopeptide (TPR) repeat protein